MYLSGETYGNLGAWIRDEIEIDGTITRGARGRKARKVQEWLSLHGIGLVIDEDYGGITERCVRSFQSMNGLPETGEVDKPTFETMTAPMRSVLFPLDRTPDTFSETMAAIARRHLAVHPLEVGGPNCGPWVRLYMKGQQGREWAWCAGFMTFLMEQAAEQRGEKTPIKGSVSCDIMASQAKQAGAFLKERDATAEQLVDGSLFLVRRTSTDWTHVGMVLDADDGAFGTLEGNTNDEGSREGFEVCARVRGYSSKDFIVFGG